MKIVLTALILWAFYKFLLEDEFNSFGFNRWLAFNKKRYEDILELKSQYTQQELDDSCFVAGIVSICVKAVVFGLCAYGIYSLPI